jgi:hypothetical protein
MGPASENLCAKMSLTSSDEGRKSSVHEREEKYSIPRKRISCECSFDGRFASEGRGPAIRNKHRSTGHFTSGCGAQTVCPKSTGFDTSAFFALFALLAFFAFFAFFAFLGFLNS